MHKNIAKNSIFLLLGQTISKILAFIAYFLIARSFGPHGSGVILAGIAFISLFIAIIDWNLHLLLTREVAKDHKITHAYFSKAIRFKLVLSLILIPVVYISSYFLYSGVERYAIWILTPGIILMNLGLLVSAIFRAFEKMQYDAIQMFFRSIFYLSLIAIISIYKFPVISIAWAFLLAEIATFILSYTLYFKYFKVTSGFSKIVNMNEVFREALPLGVAFLFANVYFYLGTVMLSKLSSTYDAGLYGMAYRLMMAVVIIPNMINFAFFPVFSKLFKKDKKQLIPLYVKGLKTHLIITLPLALGGTFLGNRIMEIFGKSFGVAGTAFSILVWILLLNTWANLSNQLIIAIHKQKITVYIAFTAMVFNIIGDIIFIPKYGLTGAALVAVGTEILLFSINALVIKHYLGKARGVFGEFKSPFIIATLLGIFLYFFNYLNIFVVIFFSVIFYSVGILVTKTISLRDLKNAFYSINKNRKEKLNG